MAEYIEKATLLNRVIIPSICSCVQGPTAERLKKFCVDTVNNVPAADVAPVVHGGWLKAPYKYLVGTCSVCGCEPLMPSFRATPYNYCPNCGAKMDEEVNDENI